MRKLPSFDCPHLLLHIIIIGASVFGRRKHNVLTGHAVTIEFVTIFEFALLLQNGDLDEQKDVFVVGMVL